MDCEKGQQAIRKAIQEVTEYATQHDEKGERLPSTLDPEEVKSYWKDYERVPEDEQQSRFDEVIRTHVFMLLKYFGDFGRMAGSKFFHECQSSQEQSEKML